MNASQDTIDRLPRIEAWAERNGSESAVRIGGWIRELHELCSRGDNGGRCDQLLRDIRDECPVSVWDESSN